MKINQNTPPARCLLRLPQVLARTGGSKSWLYSEIKKGRIPKPLKIGEGRISVWDSAAIDVLIDELAGRR